MLKKYFFALGCVVCMPVSLAQAQETKLSCDQLVAQSEKVSAKLLFQSSVECMEEGKEFEGAYLVNLGQLRTLTDLTVLISDKEEDKAAAGELYGLLYYRFGGPGPDEVYRDSELFANLVGKLEVWQPDVSNEYNPGWSAKINDPAAYLKTFNGNRDKRFSQIREYHLLYSNDEYFALKQKRDALSLINSHTFHEGTPELEEFSAIQAELSNMRKKLLTENKLP